jgi:hypothetical protein
MQGNGGLPASLLYGVRIDLEDSHSPYKLADYQAQ